MKQKFWDLYAITFGLVMFLVGATANTPLLPMVHLSQQLVVIYMLLGPTIAVRTFVVAMR